MANHSPADPSHGPLYAAPVVGLGDPSQPTPAQPRPALATPASRSPATRKATAHKGLRLGAAPAIAPRAFKRRLTRNHGFAPAFFRPQPDQAGENLAKTVIFCPYKSGFALGIFGQGLPGRTIQRPALAITAALKKILTMPGRKLDRLATATRAGGPSQSRTILRHPRIVGIFTRNFRGQPGHQVIRQLDN